jgi:glycosyltransferase involved in cell wall biosynthesis
MEHNPEYSFITPSFNRAVALIACLESIRRERDSTGIHLESIVIDDHSTDGTRAAVEAWKAARGVDWVIFRYLDKNVGPTGAKNAGIEMARGRWLVFLDSDDEMLPGALQHIDSVITEHALVDLYFGAVLNRSGRRQSIMPNLVNRELDLTEYLRAPNIGECLPVCRRSAIDNPPVRYESELRGFENFLYVRMLKRGSKLWIDPEPVRLYDDVSDDRACHIKNRSAQRQFRGWLMFVLEFEWELLSLAPTTFARAVRRTIFFSRISDSSEDQADVSISRLARTAGFPTMLFGMVPRPAMALADRVLWALRKRASTR